MAYAKTLHNPIITVRLMEFDKPYFIVGGEVGHPGKLNCGETRTMTQAVADCGRFHRKRYNTHKSGFSAAFRTIGRKLGSWT